MYLSSRGLEVREEVVRHPPSQKDFGNHLQWLCYKMVEGNKIKIIINYTQKT